MSKRAAEAARALRVGAVVLVALVVLVAGIWELGEASRLWSPKARYLVRFAQVQGLSHGSTVAVAGYTIGTVEEITLPRDITQGMVEVHIDVERRHSAYIRRDTLARIKTIGLLGDKYIDLAPGSPGEPELPPGAEIAAVQPPNIDALLAAGESLADNLVVLSTSMRRIVEKIDRGEGLLGAVISDTPEGKQLGDDIKAAVANLRGLTDRLNRGEGALPMLINDPSASRDLRASLRSLARVAREVESGEGLVARLVSDRPFARELTGNLEQASRDVRAAAARLNSDEGLLATLTRDTPEGERLLANVQEAAESLAGVARRVADGEGSLGKLLVDDTLYIGLNDMLAGARKSWLTRWFVSRSQKKGAEERLGRERATGGDGDGPPVVRPLPAPTPGPRDPFDSPEAAPGPSPPAR